MNQCTKPVVHYKNNGNQRISGIGIPAIVEPIDYPGTLVSNCKPVVTSPVTRIGAMGEFETENSIYRATPVLSE